MLQQLFPASFALSLLMFVFGYFSITCGATIPFLDLSTTLLSLSATYNMFTHPDEFNYIFSEEITVGVAQPARGQH